MPSNIKNAAPGLPTKLPLFSKGSDGTADFGTRYNPLTGGFLQHVTRPDIGPYCMSDCSSVPYSLALAQNHSSELEKHTTPSGRTTKSYKVMDGARYKHARLRADPQERFRQTVTSQQEIGWKQDWPLKPPSQGKKKCKETTIAEAQCLGPRYVDVTSPDTKIYF